MAMYNQIFDWKYERCGYNCRIRFLLSKYMPRYNKEERGLYLQ